VPSFYFYKLADAISAPYTSLDAYRAGAIDSSGNILKPVSSIDSFEFLVIKLKQIFEQLPYGTTKAKLSNYLATLNLFSEEVEAYEITQEQFHCLVEGIVCHNTNNEVSYLELLEDMGTGGGAGALGVPAQGGNINQGGVSGYDVRMKLPLMKRKKGDYFDNCEIFDVCPEEFNSFMNSKQWKDVPDSETKNYLRRFQRRNKDGKIGVRGLNPVSGEQDLFWITYPAKNFMEEVDLSNIEFLFETKKQIRTRDTDNNQEQFKAHILSLMGLHKNEKSMARKTEYEARILNHIKNYHLVKNNPTHLKSYIDSTHQTILNSASANSSDTHSVHFDDKGNMSLKPIDVKDISKGDAYVSVEVPKAQLSAIPEVQQLIDTSTESGETRVKKQPGIASKIKKAVDEYYKKEPTQSVKMPSEGLYMIKRLDGRFYMSGSESLSSTPERKVRVSPTGQQRRAKKANKDIPHPELRRVTARQAMRVLDPKKQKLDLTAVSLKADEYESTRSLLGDDAKLLDTLLKPHFE
jgi:hypothetical protein